MERIERQFVRSDNELEDRYGYSRAVRIGDRVLVAGTAPVWPGGEVDTDPSKQAERCCQIIVAALEEAGASAGQVVRTRMFITDAAISEAVGTVHGRFFGSARPVTSMVVVSALLDPRWRVEIEAEADLRADY